MTRKKIFGKVGEKVDAYDWHSQQFEKFSREATKLQQKHHKYASVAFVVFNDVSPLSLHPVSSSSFPPPSLRFMLL
jgi:hypothetical protein